MLIRIIRFLALAVAAHWSPLATSTALTADAPATAFIRENDRYIFAGNDRVELTFQKNDGRLYSLVDKSSQLDFLARKEAYWGPFNFQINITGKDEYINGSQANRFTYSTATDNDGPVLTLTWEQFRASRPTPLDIRVRITVRIPATEGLTYWTIAVTNNEPLIVQQVTFPDLEGIPQLSKDGADDEFTHPAMTGLLFQDPLNNFKIGRGFSVGMPYPSGYTPMQFITYSSRERHSGLYLATRDADGHSKFFNLTKPAENWMNLQAVHRPPLTPRTSFAPAFDVVVGVFSGDWYDAAQIYRNWALQQPWVKATAIPDRSQPTGWFPQLPLHQWLFTYPVCYDTNHFSVVPTISQDTSRFMGQPVAIDWIGWEREGWYIGYPDVLPPKEGWPPFEDAVRKTRESGNRVWTVLNTTGYSDILPGWGTDRAYAAAGENGRYFNPSPITECGKSATYYTMCPATAWREKLRDLILPLASRQVDMIQLDGFPVVGPQPCTNPAHSHPPGGGNWWYLAYRDIFEGIKREARQMNPGIIFSAEGMAEAYLGFLDSVWDPFSTGWTPSSFSSIVSNIDQVRLIPMWHAVYHDKAPIQSGVAFISGNAPSGSEGYGQWRDFYVFGFARALVWGEVPTTWYNDEKLTELNEPAEREMAAYVKRIVTARSTYASQFLVNGQMLRIPEIQVPKFHVSGAKRIPYSMTDYPPFDAPSVPGSLWRAPNGDAGYVFTNLSHDAVAFNLSIDAASTLLPPQGRYDISLVRNGIYSLVKSAASLPVTIPVSTDPTDVILITAAPAGSSTSMPAITQGGVTEAMNFQPGVAASSWISIFGRNLSATTRDWTGSPEFAQNKLPFSLDGVSVTINGKPAAVFFVSPSQVNVLCPADIGTGPMNVVVQNANGLGATVTITGTPASPAFYAPFADRDGSLFVTAVAANGDYVGKVGLDPRVKRALQPGEVVLLFGTGFGDTNPVAPTDSVFSGAFPLKTLPTIRFGNTAASVAFGGIVGPGLYQFNLTVPEVPDGDMPISAHIGAIQSASKLKVSVKH